MSLQELPSHARESLGVDGVLGVALERCRMPVIPKGCVITSVLTLRRTGSSGPVGSQL